MWYFDWNMSGIKVQVARHASILVWFTFDYFWDQFKKPNCAWIKLMAWSRTELFETVANVTCINLKWRPQTKPGKTIISCLLAGKRTMTTEYRSFCTVQHIPTGVSVRHSISGLSLGLLSINCKTLASEETIIVYNIKYAHIWII